jgi:hypothetical protein
MRRAINWFVVLLSAIFLLVGMSVTGRGGSRYAWGGNPPGPADSLANTAMLPPVRDAPDFSGAYTLDARVDELDTARYDGQPLFGATWSTTGTEGLGLVLGDTLAGERPY